MLTVTHVTTIAEKDFHAAKAPHQYTVEQDTTKGGKSVYRIIDGNVEIPQTFDEATALFTRMNGGEANREVKFEDDKLTLPVLLAYAVEHYKLVLNSKARKPFTGEITQEAKRAAALADITKDGATKEEKGAKLGAWFATQDMSKGMDACLVAYYDENLAE